MESQCVATRGLPGSEDNEIGGRGRAVTSCRPPPLRQTLASCRGWALLGGRWGKGSDY